MIAAVRTIVVAAVAVAVAYVVVLLVNGQPPDGSWWPGPAIGLAAGAVVIAHGLQIVAGRWRSRRVPMRSPERVISTFAARLGSGVPVDELLTELGDAVRFGFAADRVEVWGRGSVEDDHFTLVTAVPPIPHPATAPAHEGLDLAPAELAALGRVGTAGEAWMDVWTPTVAARRCLTTARLAPARHGGDVLGLVLVERADAGHEFRPADDRALADLGGRLGDLMRNRLLDAALRDTLQDLRRANQELRASRTRVVAAADAERRRVERDLHDGVQQDLTSLAVRLGLLRDVAATAPAHDVVAGLDALAADVAGVVGQLRALAHGIYPPLLVQNGLDSALRSAARRAPQAVTVEADGLGRLPGDIEAAIYFCCLEAMQNAAKHAAGSDVTITLTRRDDDAEFTAVDDGPGFDPAAPNEGQGLQNMRDRLGAVGGTLDVHSGSGGTTIRGWVPLTTRTQS